MIPNNIRDQLIRDEGCRLDAYRDTKGRWTVGVGHCLGNSVPEGFQHGITQTQANALLDSDLAHTRALLSLYCSWWGGYDGPSGARGGALLNMAFNMGCTTLCTFHTFLILFQTERWADAAADLRKTLWYSEVPERAERLCQQILKGEWQ